MLTALDMFGRRWAMRIIWELRSGPLAAGDLHQRCDLMSTSVLYQRLSELSDAGLVEQDASGEYQLTRYGAGLAESLEPMSEWARNWHRAQQRRSR